MLLYFGERFLETRMRGKERKHKEKFTNFVYSASCETLGVRAYTIKDRIQKGFGLRALW